MSNESANGSRSLQRLVMPLAKPTKVRRSFATEDAENWWTTQRANSANGEVAMLVPLAEYRRLVKIERATAKHIRASRDGFDCSTYEDLCVKSLFGYGKSGYLAKRHNEVAHPTGERKGNS